MEMPFSAINLLVTESIPRARQSDDDEVEMDTYYGKVKAKKKFII
jgi:hypothetical protein